MEVAMAQPVELLHPVQRSMPCVCPQETLSSLDVPGSQTLAPYASAGVVTRWKSI
jgi:hypothetical protein